eukprot:293492_1
MFEMDVKKRWTVKECLSSKWIQQKDELKDAISPLFRDSLLKYTKKNKFRVAITNLFSNYLDADVKQEIVKHFNEMDTNKDGKLSLQEFQNGLKKLNENMSSDQIEEIFKNLDFDNDLTISLKELMTSTNMTSLMSRDERLYAAFEKLDVNHDGRIDKNEMELAVKQLFKHESGGDDDAKNDEQILSLSRLKSAFDEADINNDGTVDYDEFLQVLHPEFKESESVRSLSKQSSVHIDTDAAKFNVNNRLAKGSILQPKAYSDKNVLKDKDMIISELERENQKLKVSLKLKNTEFNEAKNIYQNNITKVMKLQMQNDAKDSKIKKLEQALDKRNEEMDKLKELLKSVQSEQ